MGSNQGQEKKKKKGGWLPIIIIAAIIVVVTLFLTVLFVKDFNTIGDLFRFIAHPNSASS